MSSSPFTSSPSAAFALHAVVGALALAGAASTRADDLRPVDGRSVGVRPVDAPLRPASPVRLVDPASLRQGTAAAGLLHDRLEIVEAGSEDVGPMSTSLRDEPFEMRMPTGFTRVYRVPGSDDLLMRGNGALFVVFDESTYRRTKYGTLPVVGDGAVFHIGMPGGLTLAPEVESSRGPSNAESVAGAGDDAQVDPRVDARIDGRIAAPSLAETTSRGAMIDREALRRRLSLPPAPLAMASTGANASRAGNGVRADAAAARDAGSRGGSESNVNPSVADVGLAAGADAADATPIASAPYSRLRLGPTRVER